MRKTDSYFEKTGLTGRNFILVVIGQIISLFGNAIIRFALPLYILDQSGSAALFGMVSAFSFLPMIIMSPIGGIIADRVNKQKIMVALDFITCGLILAFLLLSGSFNILMLVIVVMMALYGIQGAYTPAVQASIPLLIREEQIMPANAVINLVSSFSGLLGPVIGGMLYGIYGLTPIVTVGCICFAFSAVMELFIKIPHEKKRERVGVLKIVSGDLKESMSFMVKEKPIMLKVIAIVFLFNMTFSSLITIGVPVLITQTLGMSSKLYGITEGIMAAGGLVGGVMVGVLSKKMNTKNSYRILVLCAMCLIPIGISLLVGAPAFVSYIIITAMIFIAMGLTTIFSVQMLSYVQIETPVKIVGKVISTLMALSMCAQPLGQSIYGLLFERIPGGQWAIVMVSAALSLLIALFSKATFSEFNNGRLPESA